MNKMIDDIRYQNCGARFLRADLHIHSYGEGGSYDVEDELMTPQNIVDKAIEKEIDIISITDHNEIENVRVAIEYATDKDVLIIPGIEVSTTQGHLLLYFPTYKDLRDAFGKLNVSSDKKRCSKGIVECLDITSQYGGIGVLAHIELDSGFEKTIGRFGPPIEDVLCHSNLFGLEISSKSSVDFYTDNDENSNRKRLLQLRRERLFLDEGTILAKLMSSDSHSLSSLGKNADGNNRLTRVKVDSKDFHSFKIALINHLSRIRIEDFIPERIPRFLGIEIEGGLLDRQDVWFNNNLTCIIGGRGAGKSTLLESVRVASGNEVTSQVVDSEVWPEKILLHYEDETGQRITMVREKNGEVQNVTNAVDGIRKIYIESYGQGDTAKTIQHSDNNPAILLNLLDKFVDFEDLRIEEEDTRKKLIKNQSDLIELRLDVKTIAETRQLRDNLRGKLSKLEQERVGELVKYQASLHKERALRKGLIEEIRVLIDTYRDILANKDVFTAVEEIEDEEVFIGKDHLSKVKSLIREFSEIVDSTSGKLQDELKQKVDGLKVELKAWDAKEREIQKEIDEKKQDYEKAGIPFDIGKINQISRDLVKYEERLKKLLQKKKLLETKTKYRYSLVQKRKHLKEKIFYKRYQLADSLNRNLKNTLEGFFATVKFEQGIYSPALEDYLKQTLDLRTSQVPKAKLISGSIDPMSLAENIKKKSFRFLADIQDVEGNKVFSQSDISKYKNRLSEEMVIEELETLEFDDLPRITVTKLVDNERGEKVNITRSISQLSLGQQQSVLLAILLHSKNKSPLIIDQPEDNLDSEFIYKSIVKNLRMIKEYRQVIIVTHNANIAVLGDAELVVPLKSTSIKSTILHSGSIDNLSTRHMACDILEGGHVAFRRRQKIYGIE
jgi:ABC-type lipoprotein export system ATPase subunit/histidinol phosphatase-like PHP family hydrolase